MKISFEAFKGYICLSIGMLCCFILGVYTCQVQYKLDNVEPHKFVITSLVGLTLISIGVEKLTKSLTFHR